MKFFRIFLLSLIVFLSIPQTAVAAEESSGFCVWNLPVISWVIRNKPCQQAAEKKANDEKELISPLPTVAAAIDTSQDIATSSAISPEYSLQIAPFMAGTGISIKGNRISNTGVLSLVAGNGIEILKSAIVNTDKGSSQNIFKEIKVHDQDTISATSNNDALTFESGDGISLSTDKDNRKIKITNTATSSSSDGWNNSSGIVSAGDTSANVSIGSTSSIGKLGVVGDTDEKTLVVRGASGQTNRLIDIQSATGSSLASFNSNGALSIGENQGISLLANNAVGTVVRLLSLRATTKYDRPWISSIDHNGRHVVTYGALDTNNDDNVHKRFELKTVGASGGSLSTTLLTRFAIDYDRDLADVIFGDIDTVGIHNDYGDRIKMVHQMRDSGDVASHVIGQWITELGSADSTVMTIDPKTLGASEAATLRFFRETNTSGTKRFSLMKGDGTSTETFGVNAGTGVVDVKANAAGITTGDGTNTSSYMNMQSNRTMMGYDGSSAVLQSGTDKKLKLNVNNSSFGQGTAVTIDTAGSVGIGTTDPGAKLHVNSNAEGLRLGDGTNVSSYANMNGNRTMVGYDGSFAVLQGGTSKGVKLNVNNASFGTGTAMTILSDGNVGIGTTNPTLGPLQMASGAYVTSGGTWTNSSDRNQKENFTDIDSLEVLQKIVNLPIQQWNYKQDGEEVKHIGPVAQDFKAAFNVGENDTSISTVDPAGIALVGIKALNQRINDLEKRIGGEPSVVASSESKVETQQTSQVSGKAKVEKTKDYVEVTFEKELSATPIVTATVAINDNGDDESKEARKAFFDQNIQYVITKQTTKGFTIQLNKDTQTDIEFNWIASLK